MKNFTFLSLILLFLIKTQNIYAKESTFTVDNILVSSELTNINNSSREKYLNIGFKKGFKNLVINLLRKEDQKKILSTELNKIKFLIENYRVVEEKRLDNKYILKLSITFDKNICIEHPPMCFVGKFNTSVSNFKYCIYNLYLIFSSSISRKFTVLSKLQTTK